MSAFAHPVSAEIACKLMHVPLADAEELIDRSAAVIAVLGVTSLASGALAEADAAAGYYQDYMNDLLDRLQGTEIPSDDIIGALLAAEGKENGVTRSEIITTMVGFIIATFHTTKAMMTNATLALLRHPDQRARLVARPELARSAWEEALRYDGAIHFMHRYASRPIRINDISIEPGQRLLLGLQAANRDERCFSDADRFIIERERNRHFGFAGGPHFCLGAQLARLEGELLLERLFLRFPRMSLESLESPPVSDLSFPMLTRLNVNLR
jgi:cytochrome P450